MPLTPRQHRRSILHGALLALAVGLCVTTGCQKAAGPGPATPATTQQPAFPTPAPGQPLLSTGQAASPERTGVHFTDVAASAGLKYRWHIDGPRPIDILQGIGSGCAFLDYDGDGNLDILLAGPKLGLFHGDGSGHFTDVTRQMGLDRFHGDFMGCAVGDYDNDGRPDIYLSGYRAALLLHNEGSAPFRNATAQMGLKPQPWGTSCGFADLDGDGYLDLFVAGYIDFGANSHKYCDYVTEKKVKILGTCGPMRYNGIQGVLYHNQAGHGFTDVTKSWGANTQHGKGLGVTFADFDDTGTVDMVIANDMVQGNTYRNLGKGRLQDISGPSGIGFGEEGQPYAGMGVDWGDYNNDGKLDLFVTTFDYEQKNLFRNDGGGLFTNVNSVTGFIPSAVPYISFGCKFLDANNDGWLDLLIASGHVVDVIGQVSARTHFRQPIQYFQNGIYPSGAQAQESESRMFTDASRLAGLEKVAPILGRGLAIGDYNNDGRMDALVVDSDGAPVLLHNDSLAEGNWVGFRVHGDSKINRDGYNTVITLEAGGLKQVHQSQACGSYMSSSDPRVHFGLGTASRVDRITVRWPDGRIDSWTDLPAGAYLDLTPGKKP